MKKLVDRGLVGGERGLNVGKIKPTIAPSVPDRRPDESVHAVFGLLKGIVHLRDDGIDAALAEQHRVVRRAFPGLVKQPPAQPLPRSACATTRNSITPLFGSSRSSTNDPAIGSPS